VSNGGLCQGKVESGSEDLADLIDHLRIGRRVGHVANAEQGLAADGFDLLDNLSSLVRILANIDGDVGTGTANRRSTTGQATIAG
jgi:hypothetical protein